MGFEQFSCRLRDCHLLLLAVATRVGPRRGSGFGQLLRRMACRAAGRNGVIAVEKARREAVEEGETDSWAKRISACGSSSACSCVEEGQAARSGGDRAQLPTPKISLASGSDWQLQAMASLGSEALAAEILESGNGPPL